MHRNVLPHVGFPLALALAVAISDCSLFAQDHPQAGDKPPVYFPYPPGLMPADLQSEIDRVNREVDQIFQEALAKARSLPPPRLAGNPPIMQGSGTELVETLGRLELFDKNLSVNRNLACSFCHMPYTGFTGPISSINATVVTYPGSVHFRFSNRKPMAYAYSPYYPPLHYNETQQDFYGGNFWDLRATGYKLQNPDAVTLHVRTADDPKRLLTAVRREVATVAPTWMIERPRTLAEHIGASLLPQRIAAGILASFGVVALLLAAVGLYGVVAFAVAQRTREIGIRVALGAQSSEVLRLMLRQGMTLAGIGLLVGLPLAIGAGKLVSGFLLGAGAADPFVFIVAAVTLGLVTLVASYVPARRASRVDPIVALRSS